MKYYRVIAVVMHQKKISIDKFREYSINEDPAIMLTRENFIDCDSTNTELLFPVIGLNGETRKCSELLFRLLSLFHS